MSNERLLTKEDFLNYKRIIEKVPFKKFKGCLYVKEMTVKEKTAFEIEVYGVDDDDKRTNKEKMENYRACLFIATVCTAEGNPLLTYKDAKVINENFPVHVVDKIMDVAKRLNRIGKKDEEELVKN